MVARSPDGSHFVGAAITMPQTAANLRDKLGLSAEMIHTMTTTNPRRAVRL
jgi:N-acetylglucosamine-6-phosphate deacetylase